MKTCSIVALLIALLALPSVARADSPTISGAAQERSRAVAFTRDPATVLATVQVFDGSAAWKADFAAPSGSQVTITLPDTDDSYWVRVRQTDALGISTFSSMVEAPLVRNTGVDGGDIGDDATTGSGEDTGDDTPVAPVSTPTSPVSDPLAGCRTAGALRAGATLEASSSGSSLDALVVRDGVARITGHVKRSARVRLAVSACRNGVVRKLAARAQRRGTRFTIRVKLPRGAAALRVR